MKRCRKLKEKKITYSLPAAKLFVLRQTRISMNVLANKYLH